MLSYFAKQRRKDSKEIKEHEQETDSLRPTCSTSASQSTEFDSAEKHINLDKPIIASDDIAKSLPLNRSNNIDKLAKKRFSSIWRSSNGIRFQKTLHF